MAFNLSNFSFRNMLDSLSNKIGFRSLQIGSTNPIWISNKNYFQLYNHIPELRIAYSRKISMILSGKIKVLNKDGEAYEQHAALDLMRKPNPIQGRNQFLGALSLNYNLYGNSFTKKNQMILSNIPKSMYVLPSFDVKVMPTGKIFDQVDIDGIIKYYELEIDGAENKEFEPSDILHMRTPEDTNFLVSESPLDAMSMPISNIKAAYTTRNIIHSDLGSKGILSFAQKSDAGGMLPVGGNKEDLEKQYRGEYGIKDGQRRIIMSKSPVQWTPMSYPMKDLLLFEEVDEDFERIIDNAGLNRHIFSSESTYNNVENGIKGAYQQTIIPEANSMMADLSEFIGITDSGDHMIMDYSHLPILQEDELTKNQAHKIKIDYLLDLLDRDIIDEETFKKRAGIQEGET